MDEPARGWRGAPVAVPREFGPADGTWPLDGLVLRRAERGELPPDGRGAWGRWGDITVIFPVVAHAGCPPRRILVQPHKITTPTRSRRTHPFTYELSLERDEFVGKWMSSIQTGGLDQAPDTRATNMGIRNGADP